MRRRDLMIGAVVAALGLGSLSTTANAQQSVDVAMSPQSNSGQSGTATLFDEGTQTRVVLRLDNPAPGPEPAHIHLGSCPNPNAVPTYPLSNVENGMSETVLPVNLGAIVSQAMAINVHRSPQELAVYVSCGDIVLDDDFTAETTIDSVRENARENTNDELKRDSDRDRHRRN